MQEDGQLIIVGAREFRARITELFDRLAQNDRALVYATRGRPKFVMVRLPPVRSFAGQIRLYTACRGLYDIAFGSPREPYVAITDVNDIPKLALNELRREPGKVQQRLSFDLRPHFLTYNGTLAAVVGRIPSQASLEECRLFASRVMAEARSYAG